MDNSFQLKNNVFKWITFSAALIVLIITTAIFIVLIRDSWPAIQKFGLIDFLTSTDWDLYKEVFGSAHVLFGSLVVIEKDF